MSEASLTHEFQYSSARHQAETAISGMWLFLATEVLFFGALFLTWIYARHWNQAGSTPAPSGPISRSARSTP